MRIDTYRSLREIYQLNVNRSQIPNIFVISKRCLVFNTVFFNSMEVLSAHMKLGMFCSTVEPLFRGHPDERPPSLERPLDNVNLNINLLISTPVERLPLLKGHFSGTKRGSLTRGVPLYFTRLHPYFLMSVNEYTLFLCLFLCQAMTLVRANSLLRDPRWIKFVNARGSFDTST